jgi:hypothetical protein
MAAKKQSKSGQAVVAGNLRDRMKVGDHVKILHYGGQRGRIVEFRGPLGPKGAPIYRVVVGRKPRRTYIELREDQLELIEAGK